MIETIGDTLAGVAIIMALVFGGVAIFEGDGTLAISSCACLAVGYCAIRVVEGERKEKGAA